MNTEMSKIYLKNKYNISGKFILYAGSIHLRKNLDALIRAFSLLSKQTNEISLIIAGNCREKRREYYSTLKSLVHSLGIENHVIFTGTIPYVDMPYLYNCAECSVNLSSYDGFPTTAVEALSCGCPVLCLRTSSFEEILGQAVKYLDSLDINLLTDALFEFISKKNNINPAPNHRLNSLEKIINIYESTIYDL